VAVGYNNKRPYQPTTLLKGFVVGCYGTFGCGRSPQATTVGATNLTHVFFLGYAANNRRSLKKKRVGSAFCFIVGYGG
jgi:hypothetical protein